MENNQIAAISVVALLLSVVGLGAVAYTYTTDSDAQAIGISRRVSTYNLIDDAVTGAKLADDAIDSEHYTDDSIDTAHIAASQITNTEMGDDAIDSAEIVDGSVDNIHKAENNSYWTVTFDKEGQYTTTTDPIATFQMPFAATLVEVSATAVDINTSGTADQIYRIFLEEAGTNVLDSTGCNITTDNTPAVATVSDTAIADNAKMEVNVTLSGDTPLLDDLTISLVFKVAHATA